MIPVILGPKKRHYIIDHHHLALALHDEGVKHVAVTVIANLSALEPDAFWTVLDNPPGCIRTTPRAEAPPLQGTFPSA